MKRPEILAPAGGPAALRAAINAGADAVYVGGSMFSARAFAGNFESKELLGAIDYCHIYDVKIYLAANTLFKEDEIKILPEYILPFYKEGLDGVIVQDMGAAAVLTREFPDLKLHASTQMSITSSYGAKLLKQLGFSRIVPARELSLGEISCIRKNTDIETEAFVHGAMCYCYSGKCMFSSFLGGRSGNRGRCAQPCRRRYAHEDKNEYIMSLKDMCTLEFLPQLIEAGIDSFKIEGRMKKPEYVAGVTSAYRRAADAYISGTWDEKTIENSMEEMRDIYNRGGFSAGYYFQRSGEDMLSKERPNHTGVRIGQVCRVAPPQIFIKLEKDVNPHDVLDIRQAGLELTSAHGKEAGSVLGINGNNFKKIKPGMEVYRTRNNCLLEKIKTEILENEPVLSAAALVEARQGEPLSISISDERISVQVLGGIVQRAQKRATSPEEVLEKMKKTTGTGLRLEPECRIDDGVFIPMSTLNELRRRAADEFTAALAKKYYR